MDAGGRCRHGRFAFGEHRDGASPEPKPDRDLARRASASAVTCVPIASAQSPANHHQATRESVMSRQYPPHSPYSAPSRTRSADGSAERASRPSPLRLLPGRRRLRLACRPHRFHPDRGHRRLRRQDDIDDIEDFDDYVEYYEDAIDRRWIWVAGVAGAILLVAVICTVVILGGGDSGSVSKTVSPPVDTTSAGADDVGRAARGHVQAPAPLPLPPGPLTPETVTTVTPEPTVERRGRTADRSRACPTDGHLHGDGDSPTDRSGHSDLHRRSRAHCRPTSTWRCRGRRRSCWTLA